LIFHSYNAKGFAIISQGGLFQPEADCPLDKAHVLSIFCSKFKKSKKFTLAVLEKSRKIELRSITKNQTSLLAGMDRLN